MTIIINCKKLQENILQKGYSVADLQRKAGLANDTLYRLINRGGKARVNTVKRIADALNVDVMSLIL